MSTKRLVCTQIKMALNIEHGKADFSVTFSKPCFACGNPTHVSLKTKSPLQMYMCIFYGEDPPDDNPFIKSFVAWWNSGEDELAFGLMYNIPMYKYMGAGLHRVCTSCYFLPYKHNLVETETRGPRRHRSRSKTQREILMWFQRCHDFWCRETL
jgi:hypothetical protein